MSVEGIFSALSVAESAVRETVDADGLRGFAPEKLIELARRVEAHSRAVAALQTLLSGAIDADFENFKNRYAVRTPADLLQQATAASRKTLNQRLRLARNINDSYPAVRAAVKSTALSVENAELICRRLESLKELAKPADLKTIEAHTVAAAIGTSPETIVKAVQDNKPLPTDPDTELPL